ncbi:hypothetical protein [Nostoc sp. DedQUE09]|uniref:beta strand repeat-containing protein n=1 Tax=Nostoc sp. DedQUE09 TaxID=3075394 RepID=UPI002AD381E8|nr:hypothetical protein [Nostoc sp. DedQUE09]MDZ7953307.1 hypothetical protein [Nostoc sp. DedQUE09]
MTIAYGLHKCLQFGLTELLGCLSVSLLISKTQAQQSNIVPDNTLGAESSQVIGNFQGLPIEVITGGATRQINLPLLTINPSVLLFNQIQANGGIINQSQAPAGTNLIGEDVTGLRVADGKSLLLAGGNINLDGGNIRAYGGNIELAGLAAPGNVGLNIAGDNLGLVIPENVERADVSLSNGAEVNVRGDNGGNITIQARNVNLAEESILRAGIDIGLGTPNSQGGDITINAIGETTLMDESVITNVVKERAFGNAGDINIATGTLTLNNGGLINASLLGQGNAGNVNINAQGAVTVTGKKDNLSGIGSTVLTEATGNGGDINIKSTSFILSNNAFLSTNIFGQGNGGNINIKSTSFTLSNDALLNTGILGLGNGGNISIQASSYGVNNVGNSGDIRITAGNLLFKDGGQLNANNDGEGNGGNIFLDVDRTITFDGIGGNGLSSAANTFAINGNAGNIQIETGSLFLKNGGSMSSLLAQGKGNGGNITINARDTVKIDGVLKDVTYNIDDRTSKIDDRRSGLSSSLLYGEGKGGDIEITTGSFSITNGANISGDTAGRGNAGNITINARDTVSVINGANISGSTLGQGNGGNSPSMPAIQ